MPQVHRILRRKGNVVLTTAPDTIVFEAISKMEANNVGALVVLKDEAVVGIITERDYLRKVILKGRSSKSTAVREIMTDQVACVTPEDNVEECMAIMTQQRCRHLPVQENGRLIGVVSIGDLVKQVIRDQKREIHYLSGYLQGPMYASEA